MTQILEMSSIFHTAMHHLLLMVFFYFLLENVVFLCVQMLLPEQEKRLLLAVILVLILEDLYGNESVAKRLWWVHPMNAVRGIAKQGEFHTQIQKLKNFPEQWFHYFHMTLEQLNFLLAKIKHKLYRQNTNWRKSIGPEERLAVCLRYVEIKVMNDNFLNIF